MTDLDYQWMTQALDLAHRAKNLGEVPVGALVVRDGVLLGKGWNRPIESTDPTAHAEIQALRAASLAVGNYRLSGTTLYCTLEPCAMCVGAIIHARVSRLVFGAYDQRTGAVVSQLPLLDAPFFNHRLPWEAGVLAEECGALLRQFFRERRTSRTNINGVLE